MRKGERQQEAGLSTPRLQGTGARLWGEGYLGLSFSCFMLVRISDIHSVPTVCQVVG